MTETDRIKNALLNVNTLAKNSIEYGKARDDQDIDLIASIVEKEIPQNPDPYSTCIKEFIKEKMELVTVMKYKGFMCPSCGYELTNNEMNIHCNYCPHCGQRIDWSEEEWE